MGHGEHQEKGQAHGDEPAKPEGVDGKPARRDARQPRGKRQTGDHVKAGNRQEEGEEGQEGEG